MDQIINNEISNSKSVQILRAEQTLESSMQKGGVKMTMNNTKTNGTNNTKGGNEMRQFNLPEFKEVVAKYMTDPLFKDLSFAEKQSMAKIEFDAMVEVAKAYAAGMTAEKETTVEDEQVETKVEEKKTEEKKQETAEEDEMDKFLEFMYKEVTARGAVTSKVASTLIYKYVDKYGADIDKVARYTAAFINYFVTDEGEKHARRVGWDILMLLGAQLGKNLVSEFDTLVDLIEIGETVVKYKTGLDTAKAVVGAYKYAKKNQQNITNELLEYGNKQKLTSMAFGAIDELMDQE